MDSNPSSSRLSQRRIETVDTIDIESSPLKSFPNNRPLHARLGEWAPYREIITDLYEEFTLKEVISIMETKYGFRASEKMYKVRLKKWGLSKYNKRQTSYTGHVQPDVHDAAFLSAQKLSTSSRSMIRPVHPSIPYKLGIPASDNIELICQNLGTYYTDHLLPNLCEDKMCHLPLVGGNENNINQATFKFSGFMAEGCQQACLGNMVEARRILTVASSGLKEATYDRSSRFIHAILRLITLKESQSNWGVTQILLSQIANMSQVTLGERHPLKLFCSYLIKIPSSDKFQTASVALKCLHDIIKKNRGEFHIATLRIYIYWLNTETDPESRARKTGEYSAKCEKNLPPSDHGLLYLRKVHIQSLIDIGNLHRAMELCKETLSFRVSLEDSFENARQRMWLFPLYAQCSWALNRTIEAIEFQEEALLLAERFYDPSSGWVLTQTRHLEEMLHCLKNEKAAAQVESLRLQRFEPIVESATV